MVSFVKAVLGEIVIRVSTKVLRIDKSIVLIPGAVKLGFAAL